VDLHLLLSAGFDRRTRNLDCRADPRSRSFGLHTLRIRPRRLDK
jgi:hypothetical protein